MARASTSRKAATPRRPPLPSASLTRAERLAIHRALLLTRKLEERLVHLYRQNKVVGGLYRSLGQEGETIGAVFAMEREDYIAPLIRNMGAFLVRGFRPRDVAMQYMAKRGGPTGGKDLNTHFSSLERRLIGPISMLGDLIPVMAGVALAAKLRRESFAALAFLGDGATSTGAFYEGTNLAAVWKLPLVVVVENNGYAYSTPVSRQMAVDTIAEKAIGLGIKSVTVDGNDVLAVYDAVREARRLAVAGEGPSLVEVMTYRRKGHAEHDMQRYVPEGEIEAWEKKDPLRRYRARLLEEGHAAEDELRDLEAEVAAFLEEEIEAALADPLPDPAFAREGVYADPPRAEDTLSAYREESGDA
jgi:pyruvate dehydrogenase E1 component alpha subunit/2-oxoisovalerate dehydrogenase E1 component alpha subunit